MSQKRYEIDDFAFIGRTFEEYGRMFDLRVDELRGKTVLDCPGGPCSFVAEARERCVDATGADDLYDRSPATLARRCVEDIDRAMASLDGVQDLYRWDFYGGVDGLEEYRQDAASRFLLDYSRAGKRYVRGRLPHLPFPDGSFDLALSGHLLFLYDDRLSREFHVETVYELLRVSDQLRVFPLHGFDGDRSGVVEPVVDALSSDGHAVEFREVPFEFQRGANEMLVVE